MRSGVDLGLGVFSAKDKGSLEVAATKSPSSPGPLVGVRTPAPPPPPLAPNPDVNKSREVVRVPESRKNDDSALEELASNRVPVRTRDFAHRARLAAHRLPSPCPRRRRRTGACRQAQPGTRGACRAARPVN